MIFFMRLFLGRTAEAGSRTLLHGITAGTESHGCYLASCEIREYVDHSPDSKHDSLTLNCRKDLESWVTDEDAQKAQKRIWADLAAILEKSEPGCVKRIM